MQRSVTVGILWTGIILMFLNDLRKRLKRKRRRREGVNEEEEEKAKILKSTSNILDFRGYQ